MARKKNGTEAVSEATRQRQNRSKHTCSGGVRALAVRPFTFFCIRWLVQFYIISFWDTPELMLAGRMELEKFREAVGASLDGWQADGRRRE